MEIKKVTFENLKDFEKEFNAGCLEYLKSQDDKALKKIDEIIKAVRGFDSFKPEQKDNAKKIIENAIKRINDAFSSLAESDPEKAKELGIIVKDENEKFLEEFEEKPTEEKPTEENSDNADLSGVEVAQRIEMDFKQKPNENAEHIADIFTLEQLATIFGGKVRKNKAGLDTLYLKNIRVKGFFVDVTITYDAAKSDYKVNPFSKVYNKDGEPKVSYGYVEVNYSVEKRLTDIMWQLAKGYISPIKIGKVDVKILTEEGGLGFKEEKTEKGEKKTVKEVKKQKDVFIEDYIPSVKEVELTTVEDTVEKYNKNLTFEEISAYVAHRQSWGVPMTGWEKYYLKTVKDESVKEEDRYTIGDFVYAKNEQVVPCSAYPFSFCEGQMLGVCIKKSTNFVFVVDRDLHTFAVFAKDVELKKNDWFCSKKDILSLLGNGMYAKDFSAPEATVSNFVFDARNLKESANRKYEILQVKPMSLDGNKFISTIYEWKRDTGKFVDSETGSYELDLTKVFAPIGKDDDGRIFAYDMPKNTQDMSKLFFTFDGEKYKVKTGLKGNKDNEDIHKWGLIAKAETLISDYDSQKRAYQNKELNLWDLLTCFYVKDNKGESYYYLIPTYAIVQTPVKFPYFEYTMFLPKSEFLRGNLRLLYNDYVENKYITKTMFDQLNGREIKETIEILDVEKPKGDRYDEEGIEGEGKKDEVKAEEMVMLPTLEAKYNKEYGNNVGTLQLDIIKSEIENHVKTYNVKASDESGDRPTISIDASVSNMDFVDEIDGVLVDDIEKTETGEIFGFREGKKVSLRKAFEYYLQESIDSCDIKSGVTRENIRQFYIERLVPKGGKKKKRYAGNEEEYAMTSSNAMEEGERLFNLFISTALNDETVAKINKIYNETESYLSDYLYNYVPFGYSANKNVFSKITFELNNAQIDGVRFLAHNGSGLLMHDVGFGKTLCSIHNLAQKLSSGEIKRPLVSVPKMVYNNWAKEMFGAWKNSENRNVFTPIANATFESGVFSGTDVKLLVIGNCGKRKADDSSNNFSKLFDQNYTLFDSNWKILKRYSVEDINRGEIPEKTIVLCTHEAIESNITLSNTYRSYINKIGYELKNNYDRATDFLDKAFGEYKNEKPMLDLMKVDYFVMDEAHNAKSLLKSVGKIAGAGSRSTLAVKTFLTSMYFSMTYGSAVNLLTATPFTNNTLEIITCLMQTNPRKWFLDINQSALSSFVQSFIRYRYEIKVKHTLEVKPEWVIGKFANRKVLKNVICQFINYNFNADTADVKRPTKINYPNSSVSTLIGEQPLTREIRGLIMKIMNWLNDDFKTKESFFVKRFNLYRKDVVKNMEKANLPKITSYEQIKREKFNDKLVFAEDFVKWYERYELLKKSEEDFKLIQAKFNQIANRDGVHAQLAEDFQTAADFVVKIDNSGEKNEAWEVYDFDYTLETPYPRLEINPTFTAFSLLSELSLCPYFVTPNYNGYSLCFKNIYDQISSLNNLNGVTLDKFLMNCGKLEYVVNCIQSIKDFHESNKEVLVDNTRKQLKIENYKDGKFGIGEKEIEKKIAEMPTMSGQVVYMNLGMKTMDEIQDTTTWDEKTMELYKGKNIIQLLQEAIIRRCGFDEEIKLGGRKYKQVEAITGETSELDRMNIQDLFQNGKIHVIIGSQSIREGINLQKRSTALYCCTLDWNPTDFQQLEGRIWRQGNEYQFVRIVTPLVQNTFDSFMYQKMGEKLKRIVSIFDQSKSNVADVSFTVSEDDLKFQIMDDVEELTKLQTAEKIRAIKPEVLKRVSSLYKLIGSYKGDIFYEGALESLKYKGAYENAIRKFITEKALPFWKKAVDGIDANAHKLTDIICDEFVQEIIERKAEDGIEVKDVKVVTNLETREVTAVVKGEDGKPKRDKDGNLVKEKVTKTGILSQQQYIDMVNKWKVYIADMENFLKKLDEGTVTIADIPTTSISVFDDIKSPTLDIKVSYTETKTDINEEGDEVTVNNFGSDSLTVKLYLSSRLFLENSSYAYYPNLENPMPEFETYYISEDKAIRDYYVLYNNYKEILKSYNVLTKKGEISKDTNLEELYRKRNDLLIELCADGSLYEEAQSKLQENGVWTLTIKTIFENDGNFKNFKKHWKEFLNAQFAEENNLSTDVLGDDADDEEKQRELALQRVHSENVADSKAYLAEYLALQAGLRKDDIKQEVEVEVKRRQLKVSVARIVAQYFARNNYIISEKFGRNKLGVIPTFEYNDDSVLGVQPTRDFFLPNETDEKTVYYKLLKIRDFIPYAQYNEIVERGWENYSEEINRIYLNVYSIFCSESDDARCLRYFDENANTGFYVLPLRDVYATDFIIGKQNDDFSDEDFSTRNYKTVEFVIRDGKETVLEGETKERGDFARMVDYEMDFNFITKAKFEGKRLYLLENERAERERVAEQEKKEDITKRLNQLLAELESLPTPEIERQIAGKLTILNVDTNITDIMNGLDTDSYKIIEKYNGEKGIADNVVVEASKLLPFDNTNQETLMKIIHILNLYIGYDDTKDQEKYLAELAEIKSKDEARKKREERILKEFEEYDPENPPKNVDENEEEKEPTEPAKEDETTMSEEEELEMLEAEADAMLLIIKMQNLLIDMGVK